VTARYPYVCILLPEAQAELCSLELWELGAQGIEQRDGGTLTAPDASATATGAAAVTLLAGFADEEGARHAAEALSPRWEARVTHVEGDDWRHAWKAYFKPARIGERLVVRPSWEPYEPQPQDLVITIDPGTAFGTGTHETTRLVMERLERLVRPGASVLDVGCGSGILSIACALLGAGDVHGIDVDPDAVRIARENAELNAVAPRVRFGQEPVGELTTVHPLVLANIETRILVPLADALRARVAPGGTLVLSGVLAWEREQALAAYSGLRLVDSAQLGDWIALVLERSDG
jgi:ribosomal protein L11 methyltransferase